jgi:hypothetical protein
LLSDILFLVKVVQPLVSDLLLTIALYSFFQEMSNWTSKFKNCN